MKNKIVIIQRVYSNYREAFFDGVYKKEKFKLITYRKSIGKIKVPETLNSKEYLFKSFNILLNKNHVFFIFLFFHLIKIKPRIVVTEGGANTINNFAVLIYCRLFKCNYAVWDLGKLYKKFNENIFRKIYNFFYDLIIRQSKLIFTYNTQSEDYFKQKYDKTVIVINNTVDTNKIKKIKEDINQETLINLKNKFKKYKYLYMYVGAINKNKKLEDLFKIHSSLGKEYGLIIVGSGNDDYIRKLLEIYNKNIYLEGYKNFNELVYYYKIVDFAILPGLGGLTIPQSMAFSKPIICSKADGTEKDMVQNNKTGYIYTNIEDAVNFIKTTDKDKWEQMGKLSENLIFSKFTIENMIENFINGIEKIKK